MKTKWLVADVIDVRCPDIAEHTIFGAIFDGYCFGQFRSVHVVCSAQ